MKTTLEIITRENLGEVLNLKVRADQEKFVAANAKSLAQAHFESVEPWFRAICADGEPVGFVMVEFNQDEKFWYLWRFMISAEHQGKGIGRAALAQVFDYVRSQPFGETLWTSCVVEAGGPGPFYEKMGFTFTEFEEDGERYMKLDLGLPAESSST